MDANRVLYVVFALLCIFCGKASGEVYQSDVRWEIKSTTVEGVPVFAWADRTTNEHLLLWQIGGVCVRTPWLRNEVWSTVILPEPILAEELLSASADSYLSTLPHFNAPENVFNHRDGSQIECLEISEHPVEQASILVSGLYQAFDTVSASHEALKNTLGALEGTLTKNNQTQTLEIKKILTRPPFWHAVADWVNEHKWGIVLWALILTVLSGLAAWRGVGWFWPKRWTKALEPTVSSQDSFADPGNRATASATPHPTDESTDECVDPSATHLASSERKGSTATDRDQVHLQADFDRMLREQSLQLMKECMRDIKTSVRQELDAFRMKTELVGTEVNGDIEGMFQRIVKQSQKHYEAQSKDRDTLLGATIAVNTALKKALSNLSEKNTVTRQDIERNQRKLSLFHESLLQRYGLWDKSIAAEAQLNDVLVYANSEPTLWRRQRDALSHLSHSLNDVPDPHEGEYQGAAWIAELRSRLQQDRPFFPAHPVSDLNIKREGGDAAHSEVLRAHLVQQWPNYLMLIFQSWQLLKAYWPAEHVLVAVLETAVHTLKRIWAEVDFYPDDITLLQSYRGDQMQAVHKVKPELARTQAYQQRMREIKGGPVVTDVHVWGYRLGQKHQASQVYVYDPKSHGLR